MSGRWPRDACSSGGSLCLGWLAQLVRVSALTLSWKNMLYSPVLRGSLKLNHVLSANTGSLVRAWGAWNWTSAGDKQTDFLAAVLDVDQMSRGHSEGSSFHGKEKPLPREGTQKRQYQSLEAKGRHTFSIRGDLAWTSAPWSSSSQVSDQVLISEPQCFYLNQVIIVLTS